MKRGLLIVVLIAGAMAVCTAAARLSYRALNRELPLFEVCQDRSGIQVGDSASYAACIEAQAKRFLERDFAEGKDASKAFLTLLVGVFVASITFSEKIVNVGHSSRWSLGAMITCWALLLLAIASCGSALALMLVAAGTAAYEPQLNYFLYERDAVYLWLLSGVVFGSALVSMFIAGVLALIDRRSQGDAARAI